MMNRAQIDKLLHAYHDLEAAARAVKATAYICTESALEDFGDAIDTIETALDTLDALRADIEAHPSPAQVCATCKHGMWAWSEDGIDQYGCKNSKLRMSGILAMPFGCTAWEAKP